MSSVLTITQIVLSILLSLTILAQERGTGLSSTFGGQSNFYHTRRGLDKLLHNLTIVLVILFFANSLAFVFIK